MSNYLAEARSDAADTADNFIDEIMERIVGYDGKASDDLLNDYCGGDSWHHENHTDKSYNLSEAAALLEELDDYEETDEGLWHGCKPREAISAQAAYTYANAVYGLFRELIEKINDEYGDLADELGEWENGAQERRERREELEGKNRLTRKGQRELAKLKKTEAEDDEDAVEKAKAAKVKAMVERVITEWR